MEAHLNINFDRTGLAGSTNVQGEEVKKLDELSNQIFVNALRSSGRVSLMVRAF